MLKIKREFRKSLLQYLSLLRIVNKGIEGIYKFIAIPTIAHLIANDQEVDSD